MPWPMKELVRLSDPHVLTEQIVRQQLNKMKSQPVEPPQTGNWRYHLRITLNGFLCHNETWDHAFEVDGKRDEVYIRADVRMFDA